MFLSTGYCVPMARVEPVSVFKHGTQGRQTFSFFILPREAKTMNEDTFLIYIASWPLTVFKTSWFISTLNFFSHACVSFCCLNFV